MNFSTWFDRRPAHRRALPQWQQVLHQRCRRVTLLCLALIVVFSVSACVHIVLSPRQQVVKSALDALCEKKNIRSIAPYVTEDINLLLDMSGPLVAVLEGVGIFKLSDEIAAACTTADVKFSDEIKVNEDRYLVRLSSKEKKVAYEFVVVKERAYWKIASFR